MVKSVLYVEKEKFLRSLLEVALRPKGIEVHTVDTLQDNVYLLRDLAPALVLLDLETVLATPDLLAEVVAYRQEFPRSKIIGIGGPEGEKAFPCALEGYLLKPLVVTNLAQKIAALID